MFWRMAGLSRAMRQADRKWRQGWQIPTRQVDGGEAGRSEMNRGRKIGGRGQMGDGGDGRWETRGGALKETIRDENGNGDGAQVEGRPACDDGAAPQLACEDDGAAPQPACEDDGAALQQCSLPAMMVLPTSDPKMSTNSIFQKANSVSSSVFLD
ncbi:hypothetical protein ACLOJK_029505 [Asimina triloba]